MAIKVIDKATQREVEVSSAEAQRGVMQGQYVLPAGRVRIAKGNRTGSVDASELLQSVANGARLVDDDEASRVRLEREESTTGSQILGGLEATAAGATLGLSTLVERHAGVDMERATVRRESLGGLGTALELGGALALGGAGLARGGAALGVRSAPAALATRAGAAVEARLATALGKGGLVRTMTPVAGRGFVEGFAQGVGMAIDESALGDRDLAAEHLLSSGVMGGVLGSAASLGIAGVAAAGAAGTQVAKKSMRNLLSTVATGSDAAASEMGWLASVLTEKNARRYAKLTGTPEDTMVDLAGKLRSDPDLVYDAAFRSRDLEEGLARELKPHIQAYNDATMRGRMTTSGLMKQRHVESKLPRDADSIARMEEHVIGLADDMVSSIDNAAMSGSQHAFLNEMSQLAKSTRDKISANNWRLGQEGYSMAERRSALAANYRHLDEMRQIFNRIESDASRIVRIAPTEGAMNTRRLLSGEADIDPGNWRLGLAGKLRKGLEDRVWGDQGIAQEEINRAAHTVAAIERAIKTTNASGRLLNPNEAIDTGDLLQVVRQSGRMAGETKTERFIEAINARREWARTLLKHYDVDDATRAALTSIEGAVGGVEKVVASQRSKVAVIDALAAIKNIESHGSVSTTVMTTGVPAALGAIGFGLGGIPGAVVGAGVGMLTRPHATVRRLAQLLHHTRSGQDGIAREIAPFLSKLAKRTGSAVGSAARGAGRAVKSAAPTVAARLAHKREDDASLMKVRERVLQLAANPRQLGEEIALATRDLDDVAPRLATAINGREVARVQYLAEHAPVGYTPPMSSRAPLIDPIEMESFRRRYEVAANPRAAVRHMANGTLTMEHVEALKAVWPKIYDSMQAMIFDALGSAEGDVPLAVSTTLSLLWEAPCDPTQKMAPAIKAAFAPVAAPAATPQAAAGSRRTSSKSGKLTIDTSRTDTSTQALTKSRYS